MDPALSEIPQAEKPVVAPTSTAAIGWRLDLLENLACFAASSLRQCACVPGFAGVLPELESLLLAHLLGAPQLGKLLA